MAKQKDSTHVKGVEFRRTRPATTSRWRATCPTASRPPKRSTGVNAAGPSEPIDPPDAQPVAGP